jgi:hypothetical protein
VGGWRLLKSRICSKRSIQWLSGIDERSINLSRTHQVFEGGPQYVGPPCDALMIENASHGLGDCVLYAGRTYRTYRRWKSGKDRLLVESPMACLERESSCSVTCIPHLA